jgi:D-serine deaminase-like pyridoxal phosphate-dependent protein
VRVDELSTPAVVVDVDVMEANVRRMASRAAAAGIALRPHGKTHKTAEVARVQLAAGAVGLTLAKTSEAETLVAAAGIEDVFLAYPIVGADKGRRLLALSDRVRLAVGVDSVEGARTLAEVFAEAGRSLDVLLKIDVGFHRVGVVPEQAAAMARRIADLRGLRIRGVFTHAGQGYGGQTPAEVAAIGRGESRLTREAAEAIRAAGIPVEVISVGSTPTAASAIAAGGITEARPGSYVFNDASEVELGTCPVEECALTVVATVVSVPAPDRAVLDAGSKTVSNDPLRPRAGSFGHVLGTRSRLARLSEEHGVIAVAEGDTFRVGQRVRVLPNHCCAVANLHDRLFAVRGDVVEDTWPVIARGKVD